MRARASFRSFRRSLDALGGAMVWMLLAGRVLAHELPSGTEPPGPRDWHEAWHRWALEPGILLPLLLTAALYWIGRRRLRSSSGEWRHGPGTQRRDGIAFWGGWAALMIALVSPLHPMGSVLFSAHMTQHEILMLVAAPLLVLAQPMVPMLKALPSRWVSGAAGWSRGGAWRRFWRAVTNPFVAWGIHAIVLWSWHIPALFDATLESDAVHTAQHLSFLLSALLFWWSVLHAPRRRANYGAGVLFLFTTAMQSGMLGAFISLAGSVWYPAYLSTTASWGLTPLEDQQLGGLIMWVPACLIYIGAAVLLGARGLRESTADAEKRTSPSAPDAAGRLPEG